jgi:endoplasmic reticulum junction formation protein lunapark
VLAVAYAVMMTRDEDLTWQMRAFRVLPMFVLLAVSSVIYSSVVNFTRMRKYLETSVREKCHSSLPILHLHLYYQRCYIFLLI